MAACIRGGMNTLILFVFTVIVIAATIRRPPSLPAFGCCLAAGGKALPPAEDARAAQD